MNVERRNLWRRLYVLVWQTDTTPTRFTLALNATILALSMWITVDCEYVGCVYLAEIAPWKVWSIAWGTYAVLKWWRIFDGANRPRFAIFLNTFGALLYCSSAIALTMARWPFTVLSASSVVLALAACWVLMRTGINAGFGFRGD